MKETLLEMKSRLETERQELVSRITEIDEDLGSVTRVLALVERQRETANKQQMSLIKLPLTHEQKSPSKRFHGSFFKNAVLELLADQPEKSWAPKEIVEGLLKGGIVTKAEDFASSARTQLGTMRKEGVLDATKIGVRYLYRIKKNGPVSGSYSAKDTGPS